MPTTTLYMTNYEFGLCMNGEHTTATNYKREGAQNVVNVPLADIQGWDITTEGMKFYINSSGWVTQR